MAEETFELGDVVQLKSGGPQMTIDWMSEDGTNTVCIWFDKDKNRQRDEFGVHALKHFKHAGPVSVQ